MQLDDYIDEIDDINDSPNDTLRLVVMGSGAVGKSTLLQQLSHSTLSPPLTYTKTIGTEYYEKDVSNNINKNGKIRLECWDIAGQDDFRHVVKAYLVNAQAGVFVFSATDIESFRAVEKWRDVLEEARGVDNNSLERIPMVLVMNKMDLVDEDGRLNCVKESDARLLADKMGMRLFKVSARENRNVIDVFEYLAQEYVKVSEEKRHKEEVDVWSNSMKPMSSSETLIVDENNRNNTIAMDIPIKMRKSFPEKVLSVFRGTGSKSNGGGKKKDNNGVLVIKPEAEKERERIERLRSNSHVVLGDNGKCIIS